MVQAMAGHEIDAYEKIYIDDELAWDNGTVQAKFVDNVKLKSLPRRPDNSRCRLS